MACIEPIIECSRGITETDPSTYAGLWVNTSHWRRQPGDLTLTSAWENESLFSLVVFEIALSNSEGLPKAAGKAEKREKMPSHRQNIVSLKETLCTCLVLAFERMIRHASTKVSSMPFSKSESFVSQSSSHELMSCQKQAPGNVFASENATCQASSQKCCFV